MAQNENIMNNDGIVKEENFIEDYGFTNTLDISVGAMLLFYLKDLKPVERQEAIQSIIIPTTGTVASPKGNETTESEAATGDTTAIDTTAGEKSDCEEDSDVGRCRENDVSRFTGSAGWSGLFPEIKARIDGIKLAELIDTARDYVKAQISQIEESGEMQVSVDDPIVGNTWKYIHNLLRNLSGREYVAQMPVEMLEMIFDTESNKPLTR